MKTQTSKREPPAVSREKSEKFYHIVRLRAQNVKKITAVDITPDDGVTIVAGQNGEGKTSVLDAIMWALGGKETVPKQPVRHGAYEAVAEVDCGEFIARREINTSGKNRLRLTRADGTPIQQPQTFLDNILGNLAFDPLEFSRMKGPDRLKALLYLTDGLDEFLRENNEQRGKLYTERRDANHLARSYMGELEQMTAPADDAPTELIETVDLLKEKNFRAATLNGNEAKRRQLSEMQIDKTGRSNTLSDLRHEILALEKELEELMECDKKECTAMDKHHAEVKTLVDPDIAEIDQQIIAADQINQDVRAAALYRSVQDKKTAADGLAEVLTRQITDLDKAKETKLAQVDFPIKGLAFGEGEVSFDGILFDQLSSSEQLRVSLAMAMSINPALRIIRITDGSLLDDKSMAIVRKMAAAADYQVWIEMVGERADATVIIEDGQVKGAGDAS